MTPYQVKFTPKAVRKLESLDSTVARRILEKLKWLSEHLGELQPEPLSADLKDFYKLRVGNYRSFTPWLKRASSKSASWGIAERSINSGPNFPFLIVSFSSREETF